ncbi:inovirus Gp2 family protein [Escherichia coli]|uniref:YagK/YfjJ domain-containing protein n=1 Tax=Escherichia coli TaxID=562 RepID=UPI0028E0C7C4|nr:inovirus-type Gp2 protein [Escherichia coli]MDT9429980.1 inovirus Gp2 family protein [Escherichia coli]MDT9471060.1 inovirus Gp2 family protein [Escherichia coli]
MLKLQDPGFGTRRYSDDAYQKAWCSAIDLDYPYYASRVNFPNNHSAWLTRQDALALSPDYCDFLLRVAYLAKEYSKDSHDGYRNFGTSQLIT